MNSAFNPEKWPRLVRRARLEAIAWYQCLLTELPAGVPTEGINQALIHLQLDVDTAQRRYHCAIP
jgi:hypothetical protein